MKKLGDKTMQKIQKLVVTATPRESKSPKIHRPLTSGQIKTQVSPEPVRKSVSPIYKTSTSIYRPMQKEVKKLQRQTQILYQELQRQTNFTIQNTHSFFLNKKKPKKPIYERAEEIVRERQTVLQEKRLQQTKLIQQRQEKEYEEYLRNLPPKRTISREKAQMISQKLYKQHFSKMNRLNTQKMEQFREDSKYFRSKPQLNETTKELYQKIAQKNKFSDEIIDRFGQYEAQKKESKMERQKQYKNRYYPFKPVISDKSRLINSARKQPSEGSQKNHCQSCSFIKSGENKKNQFKQVQVTTAFKFQ